MSRLKDYHTKRDFERSSEPRGDTPALSGEQPVFVIHKHAARNLHFDLRLEADGVLRSWALPRGPSLKPGEKRLAVEVEDHPLEYGDFEGTIPKKQYGGGTVMLWDRGHWQSFKADSADRIDIELAGSRLAGRWTLARMDDHGKRDNWLLIKRRPKKDASEIITSPGEDDTSIATGRTMAEIADNAPARNRSPGALAPEPASLDGACPAEPPDSPEPLLASRGARAPEGDRWLHEIKFDGYRLIARLVDGQVRLITRNGHDWSTRFPALRDALARHVTRDAVLDGELVALDGDGISRFGVLQDAIASERTEPLVYQLFDLLYVDGVDLTHVALGERKQVLAALLADAPASLRYTDHVLGHGPAFFKQARAAGLEGIISKRVDSRYRSGRSKAWRKTKTEADDTFIIGGYTPGEGQRRGAIGALLLGEYDGDGALVYAGRVGSGFTDRLLEQLGARLRGLETRACPFSAAVPDAGEARWVEPRLWADVVFAERTGAGLLRQARFRGLREDLMPADEEARSAKTTPSSANPAANDPSGQTAPEAEPEARATQAATDASGRPTHLPLRGESSRKQRVIEIAGVRITHPDRQVYDDPPISKQALAEYVAEAADWMLPGLADRPLSLLRCPGGLDDACFFQKHPRDAVPESVPRIELYENDHERTGVYTYVRSAADLVALVQAGTMEIHPWNARIDNVERPDRLIFDLDPAPRTDWAEIRRVAQAMRSRLTDLGLTPFLRLTGGRGVHLVVPIERRISWDTAKSFARAVCRAQARADPGRATTRLAKNRRGGRIFLDYLRNGRGATAIASYSPRARPGAHVAVDIRWDELAADRRSDHYDLVTARSRLAALDTAPWDGFEAARCRVTMAMRRAVGAD